MSRKNHSSASSKIISNQEMIKCTSPAQLEQGSVPSLGAYSMTVELHCTQKAKRYHHPSTLRRVCFQGFQIPTLFFSKVDFPKSFIITLNQSSTHSHNPLQKFTASSSNGEQIHQTKLVHESGSAPSHTDITSYGCWAE